MPIVRSSHSRRQEDSKIHPAWSVPGGVRSTLTEEHRQRIRGWLPEVTTKTRTALDLFKGLLRKYAVEIQTFGKFPSLFMGLVAEDGTWENYGGKLRVVDSNGKVVADNLDADRYQDFIGEAVQPSSYLKSPYFKPQGYPNGIYRVGPLARLNVCSRMGTPEADKELQGFRALAGGQGTVTSSFHYHYAPLIEILASLERIDTLVGDPDVLSDKLRAHAGINRLEGE